MECVEVETDFTRLIVDKRAALVCEKFKVERHRIGELGWFSGILKTILALLQPR